jgi:hypothetical protein
MAGEVQPNLDDIEVTMGTGRNKGDGTPKGFKSAFDHV